MHPQIPSERQAIELWAYNRLDGPSPHLTTEQFSSSPQSIWNELWPRDNGIVSLWRLHTTSSLHDITLGIICGWKVGLCLQTMIWRSVPESTQWCSGLNQTCFKCSDPRRPEEHGHPILAFSLVLWTQRFLQIPFDFMNCRWWDIQCCPIFHWGALFWNGPTIFRHSLLQTVEPLPILAFERFSLFKMLFLYPVLSLNCCQLT